MKNPPTILLSSLLLLCFPAGALSQEAQTQASAPKPCGSGEARQFDFWIGEWDVHADGKLRGKSSIQSILDGCTIFEEYDGVNDYSGKSLNVYDSAAGKWRQFWIDNQGGLLQLEGRYEKGRMILSGSSLAQGKETLNRIAWERNAGHGVRQHWEISTDGGESWTTAFDGRYTRRQ